MSLFYLRSLRTANIFILTVAVQLLSFEIHTVTQSRESHLNLEHCMVVVPCEDRVPYIQGFATTNFSRKIIVHCFSHKIKLLSDDIILSNWW
jgi:hypothetical protein